MEWVLQVIDEIDDVVAMLRHRWLGAQVHVGALAGGLATATAGALGAGFKRRLVLGQARS